ncbi:MAG TPA: GFA family protein [Caulobacteraceae bacterium]
MIEAVCDCGAVRLEIAQAPTQVNDCPCSWCQRLGALWAYYPPDQVRITSPPDATAVYQRAARRLEFHRCKTCGLTTHWSNPDPTAKRMGVNARLMSRAVWEAARVYRGG